MLWDRFLVQLSWSMSSTIFTSPLKDFFLSPGWPRLHKRMQLNWFSLCHDFPFSVGDILWSEFSGFIQNIAKDVNFYTLPETNIAPKDGWLEDDRLLLGWIPGRYKLLASGSVDCGTGSPLQTLEVKVGGPVHRRSSAEGYDTVHYAAWRHQLPGWRGFEMTREIPQKKTHTCCVLGDMFLESSHRVGYVIFVLRMEWGKWPHQ